MNGFLNQLSKWIDNSLSEEIPEMVVAYAFNLFELPSFSDQQPKFGVELIGVSEFSKTDSDWACEEVFQATPRSLPRTSTISNSSWQECLDEVVRNLEQYLSGSSIGATKLKQVQGVGVGFVDGEMHIIEIAS